MVFDADKSNTSIINNESKFDVIINKAQSNIDEVINKSFKIVQSPFKILWLIFFACLFILFVLI